MVGTDHPSGITYNVHGSAFCVSESGLFVTSGQAIDAAKAGSEASGRNGGRFAEG